MGQPFLNHLPCSDGVCPRFKNEQDRRQSNDRFGVDLIEPRHPVKKIGLQRYCNQGFHLGGGQAKRLSLNFHKWRIEFRKYVHRHGADLGDAVNHKRSGQDENQEPKPDAPTDDPPHHDENLLLVSETKAALQIRKVVKPASDGTSTITPQPHYLQGQLVNPYFVWW